MEIERKWLLRQVPAIAPLEEAIVEQGYVAIDNETGNEVRVRKTAWSTPAKPTEFFMTAKSSGGLCREEVELPISEENYNAVKPLCGEMVRKDYQTHIYDGHKIEVSVVDNGEFIYAEVEFQSTDEATSFQFPYPDIVEKEITGADRYKMRTYWRRKNSWNKR